jgi:hypothetical protein
MNINKKKYILFTIILLISYQTYHARSKITLTSTIEEIFNKTTFKHIIASNQADQFFVNDIPVLEADYYHKLYEAERIERESQRKAQTKKQKESIEFTLTAQNKITAKLIYAIIEQIEKSIPKLEHPALENYLLFSSETIASKHEFTELIKIIAYVKKEIPKLVNSQDTQRLEFYEKKLAPYPEKLELLFRASIDQAIEESDSTSNLKELLELIAEK